MGCIDGQAAPPSLEHQGSVSSVAFSPDGKTVLTGSLDKRRGCGM